MTPTIPPVLHSQNDHSTETRSAEYVIWQDFKPRGRGILDFVDDLLERLITDRLRMNWRPGIVTEIPISGGEPRTYKFSFRGYRGVIARMAVLCDDEKNRDPIYPYRGTGSFTDPRWPSVRFHVDFSNTPAEQRLELTPVFASEPS